MSETKKCYLKCINDSHSPITLTNTITYVGRSEETKIQEVFCSRKQGNK